MVEGELFWLWQDRGLKKRMEPQITPISQRIVTMGWSRLFFIFKSVKSRQSRGFSAESLSAIDPAAFGLYQSFLLLWLNVSVNALTIQAAN